MVGLTATYVTASLFRFCNKAAFSQPWSNLAQDDGGSRWFSRCNRAGINITKYSGCNGVTRNADLQHAITPDFSLTRTSTPPALRFPPPPRSLNR